MISIKNIRNQKINLSTLTETLFYCFPLSFIIGNLAVTLNLLFFLILSAFLIKREKLNFRFDGSVWLLVAFFSYLFISTTIQFLFLDSFHLTKLNWSLAQDPIFKSIGLIRFPILIFLVDTLFYNKILNLKKFLLSTFFCTTFVSFDVIFQYFVGFDLFGYKSFGDRNPGPFGDEWIAGSYLQKFSFFSIFFICSISKNKNFKNLTTIFVIVLHFIAIFLAGNRMPVLLFLFGFVLIILLVKNFRIIFSSSLLISMVLIFFILGNDSPLKRNFVHFINQINIFEIINVTKDNKKSENKIKNSTDENFEIYYTPSAPRAKIFQNILATTGHAAIYRTSVWMWKDQPLFGFGLKSFRTKCQDIEQYSPRVLTITKMPYYNIGFACSTHSHNYYLELLAETGIIGISLIIIFFLILLKDSFYFLKKFNKQTDAYMLLLMPIIIVFFLEIWPLKSSGSFFTSWNATFIWLNISLLMLIRTKKNS